MMSPQLSQLRRYVENGDEEAFRAVVSDYIGLVYGTARRRLNGDTALAADVTQIVFTDLARQAHKIEGGTMLGGWLHRHTCYVAAKMHRAELRRKVREQTASQLSALESHGTAAWDDIANELDEAVNELPQEDRSAILLRFLEGRPMRSVGEALGVSEDAAQKRTHRALEKLKLLLERKGVAVSIVALGAALSTEAAASVPASLLATVSSAALTTAASHSVTFSSLLKMALVTRPGMALTVVALLCGGLFLSRQFNSKPSQTLSVAESSASAAPVETAGSNHVAADELSPSLPTAGDEASKRLQAHANDDDEALIAALYEFWNKVQTAPESDKPSFRAAIPLIAGFWSRDSDRVKDLVLSILTSSLLPPTDRVIDICLDALGSTNQNLVNNGTAGLSRSGSAAAKAVPALIEQLQRNFHNDDSGPIKSSTARMSLEALANIGPPASNAVSMLTTFLQVTDMMYRVIGARAYWHVTGDAQTVLPILTKAMLDEHSFWAADILGEMGASASPAIESLREAYRGTLTDDARFQGAAADVRLRAYKALLVVDPNHPPDIQGIQELTETRSSITRLGAIEALWEYSHDSQLVLPLLLKTLPDRESYFPDVNKALEILGQMGPSATDALPAVRKILEEPTGATVTRMTASNTWSQIAPGTPIPAVVHR